MANTRGHEKQFDSGSGQEKALSVTAGSPRPRFKKRVSARRGWVTHKHCTVLTPRQLSEARGNPVSTISLPPKGASSPSSPMGQTCPWHCIPLKSGCLSGGWINPPRNNYFPPPSPNHLLIHRTHEYQRAPKSSSSPGTRSPSSDSRHLTPSQSLFRRRTKTQSKSPLSARNVPAGSRAHTE